MKSLLLMGVIILTRLGGTLLVFALAARFLSLPDFGMFVSGYSLAMILAVAVDYGYSQSLLRDIGADRHSASLYVSDGIRSKVILAAFALLASPLLAGWFFTDFYSAAVFMVLFGFALCNSFAEFLGAAMRATGRYHEEALIQSLTTLAMIVGMLAGGYFGASAMVLAGIVAASKLVHLLSVLVVVLRHIPLEPVAFSWSGSLASLKRCAPYAADQGTTKVLDNIDVLIVSYALGASSAGIYQAGQKLMLGFGAFGMIVSNVYLPRLADASKRETAAWKPLALRIVALMLIAGLAGLVVFSLNPQPLIAFVYGDGFAALVPLMPLFGLLLLLRFFGGAFGIMLTAMGLQSVRLTANLVSLTLVLAMSVWLVRQFGIVGMIYSLLVSVIVLTTIYMSAIFKSRTQSLHTLPEPAHSA